MTNRRAHKPTPALRRCVELLAAAGVGRAEIVGALGISETSLYVHYDQEMRRGAEKLTAALSIAIHQREAGLLTPSVELAGLKQLAAMHGKLQGRPKRVAA
jgi:hypothetical protein